MSNRQGTVLTLFAIGVFMAGLDNGIVSSALTTLISSFKISAAWGAWTVTIYTLGLSVSIPVMAKLSDRYGRKRMFLLGVALFGIGSMLVALSNSFPILLISRVVQALGGGSIFPIANGYIVSTVAKDRQGRALGLVGGMNGIAAILGPTIGSFLLGMTGDWHWLFWINVPIAFFLVLAGWLYLDGEHTKATATLDYSGIVLLSLGMLSLMYSFTNLKGTDVWSSIHSPAFYGFFIVGILLLLMLGAVDNRASQAGKDSLIPMQLLKRTELRWTLLIGLTSGLTLASVIFLPAFNQVILGWPSAQAGYWYTPMALASGVGAMGGGAVMDRRGPIPVLIFGAISAFVGAILFPLWVTQTWQMVVASGLLGLGVGLTLGAPLNLLITENVPDSKSTALGILSLTRLVGMTLGPTIFAGFLSRSMAQFPGQLMHNLSAVGIAPNSLPAVELAKMKGLESFGNAASLIAQIPSPPMRQAILSALHAVAVRGFNELFYAAAVVAVVGLLFILTTSYFRKRARTA